MKNLTESRLYHAAVYVRLSREDGDREESDSIINQKCLIREWLKDRSDIVVQGEFADDGYSGVNFERPAFKRMMREIEEGRVDCIIVKDLSRFGRNFVEAGRFLDRIFPEKGIRFIAINDHFDSLEGISSTDRILIPFKNLINDAYCRDISIKVRSQLETKRKKGDFIGSFAVYGYVKSADDRHKLEVDSYAAGVVRDIFRWKLEGMSQLRIAEKLNAEGILSPMEYKRSCGLNYKSGFQVNTRTEWTAVTVGRILRNEFYLGTMVQGCRTTPNHKVKKTVLKPDEEWIRVEDTHEAIIGKEDFYAVAKIMEQDMRVAPKEEKVYLLSGLVFCGDCGQNMVRNSVKRNGKTYAYYMCGRNRTEHVCSSHRISTGALEEAVFLSLNRHISAVTDMEKVLEYIDTIPLRQEEMKKADIGLLKNKEEEERLTGLKESLYESMMEGLIDKNEYLELKAVYDEKLQKNRAMAVKLQEEMDGFLMGSPKNAAWIERFKKFRNLTELTREAAVTLIESVKVYEDSRIEVRFKYQDSYERACALVESMAGRDCPNGREAV
ncbi:MAG: recombinase family protein [Lachnospiraceae bacterium]|nr:recombinase family protein [Lachnospiraceae bacterium]